MVKLVKCSNLKFSLKICYIVKVCMIKKTPFVLACNRLFLQHADFLGSDVNSFLVSFLCHCTDKNKDIAMKFRCVLLLFSFMICFSRFRKIGMLYVLIKLKPYHV